MPKKTVFTTIYHKERAVTRLRPYAAGWKVMGWLPDEVTEFFN
jgi:hypothetical protein